MAPRWLSGDAGNGEGTNDALVLLLSLAAVGLIVLVNFYYAAALRRSFRYYITNERCIFVGGIVRYPERSIPYHKITDVELSRHLLERQLGLSSIRIFTPGTSSNFSLSGWSAGQTPELMFEGLLDAEIPTETINLQVRDSKDAVYS